MLKKFHFETQNFSFFRQKEMAQTQCLSHFTLAGAEGLEPSARGFGDRCSTN